MSSFLHQRNVPTGKIRYSNGGDSRRNYEGKERNQPVFPRCAINIVQPEDVVVGSIFVYTYQRKRWRNKHLTAGWFSISVVSV